MTCWETTGTIQARCGWRGTWVETNDFIYTWKHTNGKYISFIPKIQRSGVTQPQSHHVAAAVTSSRHTVSCMCLSISSYRLIVMQISDVPWHFEWSSKFAVKDGGVVLSDAGDFKWNNFRGQMAEEVTSIHTQVCNAYPKFQELLDCQVCISRDLGL